MLNTYPDSLGKNMGEMIEFLSMPEMKDVFQSLYLMPSVFNSDIDRGYSIITYDLAETVATEEDFAKLREMGFDMIFDFILNHRSVLCPEFRDLLKNGDKSKYRDYFINWNEFWEGNGTMGEDGVMIPDADKYDGDNRRRAGYPILMVRFPDGREVPFWNTFFQKVFYPKFDQFDLIDLVDGKYDIACALASHINESTEKGLAPSAIDWTGYEAYKDAVSEFMESRRRYLGQMDVNGKCPLVWEWFDSVLKKLSELGASLVRLDAVFALLKQPGKRMNSQGAEAWALLNKIGDMAAKYGMDVLPENHSAHKTGAHRKQWEMGVPTYDYFLPVLLMDAMDLADSQYVYGWAKEQLDAGVRCINMLGHHDGIPLRDPRGALPDERVDAAEKRMVERGGRRKCVHNGRDLANTEQLEAYQMDIAYYSAIGCDDDKLLLARAVQIFMPGKPQIWYQDLLAGANDLEVFERVPDADNREINRHNYTLEEIKENLKRPVVQKQLELLRFRNTHPAFTKEAKITAEQPDGKSIVLRWEDNGAFAQIRADFAKLTYEITCSEA